MATSKKATKKSGKKSTKKSSKRSAAAQLKSGAVPPYGDPIRGAIARGDKREMKNLAASTRKYLAEVESALEQLESSLKTSS